MQPAEAFKEVGGGCRCRPQVIEIVSCSDKGATGRSTASQLTNRNRAVRVTCGCPQKTISCMRGCLSTPPRNSHRGIKPPRTPPGGDIYGESDRSVRTTYLNTSASLVGSNVNMCGVVTVFISGNGGDED